MCFDMLTCRMRITYEQLVLYLFYLLNAEKHGLVPGDTLKAVTKLQSASDLEQNREALSLALIRKTQPQPACAVSAGEGTTARNECMRRTDAEQERD